MRKIFDYLSKTNLDLILNQLLNSLTTREQAIYKIRDQIISDIYIEYTKIDKVAFYLFIKNLNLVEVTYRKINREDIKQLFLGVIKR